MIQEHDRTTDSVDDREGGLSTADLAQREPQQGPQGNRERSASEEGESDPLFPPDEAHELRSRWDSIQAGFVDEPRRAVEEADSLVAAAMKQLAETFADERRSLEAQWDRGDDVSTEDLRVALRKYRSFFGRLLSM
jgi:hypothetical protein